jgi:hypothetical protein
MDLALLATLKQELLHAQDFKQIWSFFMDNFGEDPAFMKLGERVQDPMLEAIVKQICGQVFGKPVSLGHLLLTRLPEHEFIHGGLVVEGKLGMVLYFEDIQVGLLTVVMAFGTGDNRLVRFTGRPLHTN